MTSTTELTLRDLRVCDYLRKLYRLRCLELVEEMQARGERISYDEAQASLFRLEGAGKAYRNSRGYWRPCPPA